MSVCLSVSLLVCMHVSGTTCKSQTSLNFLGMLPLVMTQSCCDSVPMFTRVLWLMSRLHMMAGHAKDVYLK